MASFGGLVIAEAVAKALHPVTPSSEAMGIVALAALAGNALCFWLLYRHRSDDLNMRSTWLCSRNDLIANLGVIGAALAVARTGRAWPDIVVGLAIAILFLQTALGVLRDSTVRLRELRSVSSPCTRRARVDRAAAKAWQRTIVNYIRRPLYPVHATGRRTAGECQTGKHKRDCSRTVRDRHRRLSRRRASWRERAEPTSP